MFRSLMLVGIGGAVGSIARFSISKLLNSKFNSVFPLSTFAINILGCFILGIVFGFASKQNWSNNDFVLLAGTGFCGGFTTFSTFAFENLNLIGKQQSATAFYYSIISLVLGIILCKFGFLLGDKI